MHCSLPAATKCIRSESWANQCSEPVDTDWVFWRLLPLKRNIKECRESMWKPFAFEAWFLYALCLYYIHSKSVIMLIFKEPTILGYTISDTLGFLSFCRILTCFSISLCSWTSLLICLTGTSDDINQNCICPPLKPIVPSLFPVSMKSTIVSFISKSRMLE